MTMKHEDLDYHQDEFKKKAKETNIIKKNEHCTQSSY